MKVPDAAGNEIGLGDEVEVSENENGVIIGLSIHDGSGPQVHVDYVCGDGRRIESWWAANRVIGKKDDPAGS